MRFVDAIEFAKRVKPQKVIPIHEVFIKESFMELFYESYEKRLREVNIVFVPLGSGNKVEV